MFYFTPLRYSPKPRAKLLYTQEEWEVVNNHFSQVVVPQLLAEHSPESKTNTLSEEVYNLLAGRYGTRQNSRQKKSQDKLAQALNKAKKEKNEAQWVLHHARAMGTQTAEEIMSLARKLYVAVRTHNRYKKLQQRAARSSAAGNARSECHQNFWPFAK